jgi:DNA primase
VLELRTEQFCSFHPQQKGFSVPAWINFKELRSRLSFEKVLEHYGIEVKRKGKQHHGYCPLPNHNGKRNSPSFSADLERGIFQCFGCGAKGNMLDFAALMEKTDPKDGEALRKVALDLQKRFFGVEPAKASEKKPEPKDEKPVVVNAPLDFELKGLDPVHPYLSGRGFNLETVVHFGLGFSSRGMLKDRIAIPLHDSDGKLVGYAGRVIDDGAITEDNPRYRFPGARERDGKIFEFRKNLFLYNGFRLEHPLADLAVVEGFTAVWWLTQNGFPHVVGTMGADCSDEQAGLIAKLLKPDGRVWILSDGDPAGERFAHSVLAKVSPHRFVRWVKLGEGAQPTDLSGEELKTCFTM